MWWMTLSLSLSLSTHTHTHSPIQTNNDLLRFLYILPIKTTGEIIKKFYII